MKFVWSSSLRFALIAFLCISVLAAPISFPASDMRTAHAAGEMKPFPQQVSYPGITKPNHVSQAAMNSSVTAYYDYWKGKYLKNNLASLPGGYYVKGEITGSPDGFIPLGSSEGQGFGMVITVLMAGYDPNAQTIYDGLFKTARAYRSSSNPNLMGWVVADNVRAQGHFGSATDGDLDIAYSLLLADRQWGSNGAVNYLAEAKKMITDGIKASYVTSNNRLNLGDWDSKSALNTRPSDWMLSHLRAFYDFTGDQTWLNVINNLYDVYSQVSNTYSPTAGLISDFVVGNPAVPAPEWYLNEFKETDEYYWNAARVPLRVVMDYALYGEARSKTISDKIAGWIKSKTGGNPANVRDGYQLNGNAIGSYATAVFVAPFIAAGTSNSANQAWVNAGWDWMKNAKESYYSDTYNLLNMLFISGNWWKPVPGTAAVNGNLADNPGFETGDTTGWTYWSNSGTPFRVEYGDTRSGNYRLTHNNNNNAAYQVITSQVKTVPNGNYTLSVWVKSTGGHNALRLFAKNYGSTVELQANVGSTTLSSWTEYVIPNIPVTNGQIEIGVYSNANANNWAAFDDFYLTRNYVNNPGFETADTSGWMEWHDAGLAQRVEYGGQYTGSYKLVHQHSASYKQLTSQIQTLPNGSYKLSAWFSSNGGQKELRLFAKNFGGTTELQANLGSASVASWTRYDIDNINVTNGQIEFGVWSDANANNWAAIDDFILIKK
ncbi:hypothetical protein YSY43_36810 [Paenibacillus sp. YSY-4.3]